MNLGADDHFVRGLRLRDEQRMEEALAAITQAAALHPQDPQIAFAYAQMHFETWRPSAKLFRNAQRLDPDNLDITRNAAMALRSEGQPSTGENLLVRALEKQPDWIDGHKTLSTMRITAGDSSSYDRSFAEAIVARPANLGLRLAHFHSLSVARNWERAREVIADSAAYFGEQRALTVAQIYLTSETGEKTDENIFDPVKDMDDIGLDLCHVRHSLRNGRPDKAEEIAARRVPTAAASIFWPYLSLCWRLRDDPRAAWLDGAPPFIATYDLEIAPTELNEIAAFLRELHVMQAPYPEQSVRGGTQTDRQLFFHHSPVIQQMRNRFHKATADYVAALPQHDGEHPLLKTPRSDSLFEGSWSVRLQSQGYHSCHTHSRGWISSAFYVALPDPEQLGSNKAGWINFGTPPPELNLDLQPYKQVEPKVGRLVLFPSTMWHGTNPFNIGERLTIAFDIRKSQLKNQQPL